MPPPFKNLMARHTRRARRRSLTLRRKGSRKSFLRRRSSRSSRKQRGGATLDTAEDYPWASVTTLNEEGVPQTQSVSSFKEMGRDDADPEAPAAKQGLNA